MDRPPRAAYARLSVDFELSLAGTAQTLTSREPATASTGHRAPPRRRRPRERGNGSAAGTFAAVGKWRRRAPIAFATLVTALWIALPAAADPVQRVLSLVSEEKYSEARAALAPLLQSEPNAPRLRLLHGILRAREGRPYEAIAIFDRLRNDRPEMFEPYNNLAVLYAEQGRLDDARDALMAALERRPDAVAYANLGDIYMRLADRAYSRAVGVGARVPAPRRIGLRSPAPAVSAKPVERPEPKTTMDGTRRPDIREGNSPKAAAPQPPPEAAKPPAPGAKPPAPAAPRDGRVAVVEDPGNAGKAGTTEPAPAGISGDACVHAGKFKDREALSRAVEWMHSNGAEVFDLRHEADPGRR